MTDSRMSLCVIVPIYLQQGGLLESGSYKSRNSVLQTAHPSQLRAPAARLISAMLTEPCVTHLKGLLLHEQQVCLACVCYTLL